MLKKNRQIARHATTAPRWRKPRIATPILLASIAILGLRLPSTALADEKKDRKPFETHFLSADNGMIVAIRPKAFFELPGFDEIADLFKGRMGPLENSPVEPKEIERFVVSTSNREVEVPEKFRREGMPKTMSVPDKTTFYIRTSDRVKADAFDRMFPMYRFEQDGSDATHKGKSYRKVEYKQNFFGRQGEETAINMARWQPSTKSILLGTEEQLKEVIDGKPKSPDTLKSPQWKAIHRSMFAIAFDSTMVETMRKGMERTKDNDPMAHLAFEVVKDLDSAYASIDVPDDIQARAILVCKTANGAETVAKTLGEMLTLGRTMLAMQKGDDFQGATTQFAKKILKEIKIGTKGKEVHISVKTDYDEFVLGPLFEGVAAAKKGAARTQSMNNMKQLGLAFHNYTSATNKFPTAVVMGPNGHAHSWRVELLPYIGAAELYNEYRFEEAWDSPHNKKLIERMPEVFRHPDDAKDSTSSRYYTFVGPGTIMGGKEGLGFKDVRDGTSKTILYVEAKRDFPWTKPVDIEYDPQTVPDLGKGGFNATFADGSVRYISENVDAVQLHNLIQIDDQANAAADDPSAPRATDGNIPAPAGNR